MLRNRPPLLREKHRGVVNTSTICELTVRRQWARNTVLKLSTCVLNLIANIVLSVIPWIIDSEIYHIRRHPRATALARRTELFLGAVKIAQRVAYVSLKIICNIEGATIYVWKVLIWLCKKIVIQFSTSSAIVKLIVCAERNDLKIRSAGGAAFHWDI